MNKKKLIKQIEKHYWANGQHIILDTWEMMEGNDRDCLFDVQLADSGGFLFTIQNYNGFKDCRIVFKSYFKSGADSGPKCEIIETWDGVKASCTPLYLNQTITLPTFKQITKEDIIHATDYFIHEVLGLWLIFNIKFIEEKKPRIEDVYKSEKCKTCDNDKAKRCDDLFGEI